jgi:iron complex transport system substrate-binding protein
MKLKNKILSSFFIVIFTIITLIGCSNKTTTMTDREGNSFNLPKKVNTIISTATSNTEILVRLGLSDKLIAVDKYSTDIDGIDKDLTKIDFRNPDTETIVGLKPDLIIASGHNKTGNEDPFAAVKETGIEVVYVPTSSSIEDLYKDIDFIAKVTGTEKEGTKMIEDMKNRDGFKDVNAVKTNNIFYIDKNSSSRPSQNIIKSLKEIAKTIYPEKYSNE